MYYTEKIGGIDAHIYGDVSEEFISSVSKAYMSLPSELRAFCEGLKPSKKRPELILLLARRFSEVDGLNNMKFNPTIDDPRVHVDQISGLGGVTGVSLSEQKAIVDCFNTHAEVALKYRTTSSYEIPAIFRHEMGHFFDGASGHLSNNHNFREAYSRDINRNNGIEALRRAGYGYYVQDWTPNPNLPGVKPSLSDIKALVGGNEVFAEAFAYQNGGGIRPELYEVFPETFEYVAYITEEFYKSIQADAEKADEFQDGHEYFQRWAGSSVHPKFAGKSDEKTRKDIDKCDKFLREFGDNYTIAKFYDYIEFIERTAPTQANAMISFICWRLAHEAREAGSLSKSTKYFIPHLIADALEFDDYIPQFLELIDIVNKYELENEQEATRKSLSAAVERLEQRGCLIAKSKFEDLVKFIEESPIPSKAFCIQYVCELIANEEDACARSIRNFGMSISFVDPETGIELEEKAKKMFADLFACIKEEILKHANINTGNDLPKLVAEG